MSILIPLRTGIPYFDLQVQLEEVTYTLIFRWNERQSAWFLDIANEDDTVVYEAGIRLVVNFPLAAYKAGRLPPGALVAVDTRGQGIDPGYSDLGTRVLLLYYSASEIGVSPAAAITTGAAGEWTITYPAGPAGPQGPPGPSGTDPLLSGVVSYREGIAGQVVISQDATGLVVFNGTELRARAIVGISYAAYLAGETAQYYRSGHRVTGLSGGAIGDQAWAYDDGSLGIWSIGPHFIAGSWTKRMGVWVSTTAIDVQIAEYPQMVTP